MTFSAVFDTGLHADCVRYVPRKYYGIEGEIAVFSCYELDEKTGRRLGKLILAEHVQNNEEVKVIQTVSDIPGVFEFCWFPGDFNVLVAALAEGPPKLFQYEDEKLVEMEVKCDETDLEMTLAIAGDSECFVTCDNRGIMRQWSLNSSKLEISHNWHAHDAEIWYVSQDKHDRNLFYSGSDDYSMKCWDVRSDPGSSAVAVNKTSHEAGVCCVVSSPWDEFALASGSYDGKVRLWDRRVFRGDPITSIECGSGAWRVAWNPQKSNEISVAAMRAGFHVIDLEDQRIIRTESVEDHVAYGIDWHPNGSSLASCSFYNNQGQFFNMKK